MTRLLLTTLVLLPALACSNGPAGPSVVDSPLSPQVEAAVEEALMDEYRAETIYFGVLQDFGIVVPFQNIVVAEERHSLSLIRVLQNRALPVPANPHTTATVPHFATVAAACAAGVTAEVDNAAIYARYLSLDLPADVRQVFERNRAASLNNHLPAFERCASP